MKWSSAPILGILALALSAGCSRSEATERTANPTADPTPSLGSAATEPSAARTDPTAVAEAPPAPSLPHGMVTVPEGVFTMGGESSENTPRHDVAVARFAMDVREVTVDEYEACVKSGGCKPMRTDNPFCNALHQGRGKHPVNCIDWNDANAFCTAAGKRLPTEREWEYAAKGGPKQHLYSWGPEEPDSARSCYNHTGGTCEVETHPAGVFGLHDMTGNVWEWTSSWYGTYPAEATGGRYKVYRGGSWSRRFAKWMRGDLRNRYEPHEQSASVGFRCAKDVLPFTCPAGADAKDGACLLRGDAQERPLATEASTASARQSATAAATAVSVAASSSAPSAAPSDTPVRSRAPSHDADCQKNYPGHPVAYQWSGGSFQAREPLIRSAGCKKRDISVGWSSACCAN